MIQTPTFATPHLRGRAAAMAAYDGFCGPVTLQAVEEGICPELRSRLTGREYGLVMSAVNAAFHRGRASAGAELIDGDLLHVAAIDRGWPVLVLEHLSYEHVRVPVYIPCTMRDWRCGENTRWVNRDGEWKSLGDGRENWAAERAEAAGEQLYWRNLDTHTIVRWRGVEIDRLPFCA